MDSCFATFATLFVIISAASCAPASLNLHDACGDVKSSSLALNRIARSVSMEAKNISRYSSDFTDFKVDWMEAEDMCNPDSLKHKSAPCLVKMLKVLTNYSSEVEKLSGFESCSLANKVKPELRKLLDDMNRCVNHTKILQEIITVDTQTMAPNRKPLLCRYTMDRLFSFSILTARVFALGDPTLHTKSLAQPCP